MRRLYFVLAIGLFCCTAFADAAKPDFSGTWKLNDGKSQPHGSPDQPYINTITQSKGTITVATKAEGVTNILDGTFPITGKPRIEKMGNNYRYTKCSWEGSTLVFEITDKDGKKDTSRALMYIRESWTLSFDGKVLTRLRRSAQGKGVVDQKFVLDKQ